MVRLTLRLPDDLHERLLAANRESGESLNHAIVAILNAALGCEDDHSEETPLERERSRVREASGDLVVEIDPAEFAPYLNHGGELPDRQALFDSMARLDPPLSRSVIEDREDRNGIRSTADFLRTRENIS